MATIHSSQRLAHFSTVRNVDRLIYCVRDGYRSFPVAMAAILILKIGYFLYGLIVMYKTAAY